MSILTATVRLTDDVTQKVRFGVCKKHADEFGEKEITPKQLNESFPSDTIQLLHVMHEHNVDPNLFVITKETAGEIQARLRGRLYI